MSDTPSEGDPPVEDQDNSPETQPIPEPVRQRLEETRRSITHHFTINGLTDDGPETVDGYIIVGVYGDGRPGEVFIKIAKQGSAIRGLMDTVGVLTSLLLQYGVPVEDLVRKLEHVRFEPSGRTNNEQIRQAKSLVDYIFRWLGTEFSEEYRQQQQHD